MGEKIAGKSVFISGWSTTDCKYTNLPKFKSSKFS